MTVVKTLSVFLFLITALSDTGAQITNTDAPDAEPLSGQNLENITHIDSDKVNGHLEPETLEFLEKTQEEHTEENVEETAPDIADMLENTNNINTSKDTFESSDSLSSLFDETSADQNVKKKYLSDDFEYPATSGDFAAISGESKIAGSEGTSVSENYELVNDVQQKGLMQGKEGESLSIDPIEKEVLFSSDAENYEALFETTDTDSDLFEKDGGDITTTINDFIPNTDAFKKIEDILTKQEVLSELPEVNDRKIPNTATVSYEMTTNEDEEDKNVGDVEDIHSTEFVANEDMVVQKQRAEYDVITIQPYILTTSVIEQKVVEEESNNEIDPSNDSEVEETISSAENEEVIDNLQNTDDINTSVSNISETVKNDLNEDPVEAKKSISLVENQEVDDNLQENDNSDMSFRGSSSDISETAIEEKSKNSEVGQGEEKEEDIEDEEIADNVERNNESDAGSNDFESDISELVKTDLGEGSVETLRQEKSKDEFDTEHTVTTKTFVDKVNKPLEFTESPSAPTTEQYTKTYSKATTLFTDEYLSTNFEETSTPESTTVVTDDLQKSDQDENKSDNSDSIVSFSLSNDNGDEDFVVTLNQENIPTKSQEIISDELTTEQSIIYTSTIVNINQDVLNENNELSLSNEKGISNEYKDSENASLESNSRSELADNSDKTTTQPSIIYNGEKNEDENENLSSRFGSSISQVVTTEKNEEFAHVVNENEFKGPTTEQPISYALTTDIYRQGNSSFLSISDEEETTSEYEENLSLIEKEENPVNFLTEEYINNLSTTTYEENSSEDTLESESEADEESIITIDFKSEENVSNNDEKDEETTEEQYSSTERSQEITVPLTLHQSTTEKFADIPDNDISEETERISTEISNTEDNVNLKVSVNSTVLNNSENDSYDIESNSSEYNDSLFEDTGNLEIDSTESASTIATGYEDVLKYDEYVTSSTTILTERNENIGTTQESIEKTTTEDIEIPKVTIEYSTSSVITEFEDLSSSNETRNTPRFTGETEETTTDISIVENTETNMPKLDLTKEFSVGLEMTEKYRYDEDVVTNNIHDVTTDAQIRLDLLSEVVLPTDFSNDSSKYLKEFFEEITKENEALLTVVLEKISNDTTTTREFETKETTTEQSPSIKVINKDSNRFTNKTTEDFNTEKYNFQDLLKVFLDTINIGEKISIENEESTEKFEYFEATTLVLSPSNEVHATTLNTNLDQNEKSQNYPSYISKKVFGSQANMSVKIEMEDTSFYVPSTAYLLEDLDRLALNITWKSNDESRNNSLILMLTESPTTYLLNIVQLFLVRGDVVNVWQQNVPANDTFGKNDYLVEFEDDVRLHISGLDFLKRLEMDRESENNDNELAPSEIVTGKTNIVIIAGCIAAALLLLITLYVVITKTRRGTLKIENGTKYDIPA